jgi:hypothetical protein
MNTNQDQNSQSTPSGLPSRSEQASHDNNPQGQSPSSVLSDDIGATDSTQRPSHIAFGLQLDLSEEATVKDLCGCPVYMAAEAYQYCVMLPAEELCQDETSLLVNILVTAKAAFLDQPPFMNWVEFQVMIPSPDGGEPERVCLVAEAGIMDSNDPRRGLTIGFPLGY